MRNRNNNNNNNNSKPRKGKGKGKKKAASRAVSIPRPFVHISKCGIQYGLALLDPFNVKARGACIPDAESFPVRRLSVYGRFTGRSSANGFGYATFNPYAAIAGDVACVRTSVLSSTATATTAFDTMLDSSWLSNSPFTASQFGSDTMQYRIVGGGMRLFDTAPPLTTGGTVSVVTCPYVDLNDTNFANISAYSHAHFGTYRGCKAQVNYYPSVASDMDFKTTVSSTLPIKGAIVIQSDTADPTFAGDFIVHYEVAGRTETKVPVHTDMNVYAAGRQLAGLAADNPKTNNAKSETSVIADLKAIVHDASGVFSNVREMSDSVRSLGSDGMRALGSAFG
jgi:hypothetical protein